jgi:hypothetical protein
MDENKKYDGRYGSDTSGTNARSSEKIQESISVFKHAIPSDIPERFTPGKEKEIVLGTSREDLDRRMASVWRFIRGEETSILGK